MRLLLDTCIIYPFDRLLIAQAQCESMRVLTYDPLFARYLPDTMLLRGY